jgi:hypothetical protein
MNIEEVLETRDPAETGTSGGIAGTWTNELGSVMELRCEGDGGALSGTYTSGVRDRHTYELTGYANATTIVFAVNFASSASIGAWAGHYDPEQGTLVMLWHLVAEPKAGELWDTTFAGFDTFTRAA